jgi:methionyl-tRNA synthetase
LPDHIYVNAFLGKDGKKISKSLGNVVTPKELVGKYGVDPVRYYFLRYGPIVEDTDFSEEHFKIVYNADLANGLGNTVARLAKLAEKSGLSFVDITNKSDILSKEVTQCFEVFRVDLALQNVWSRLSELDKHINENTPWSITDEKKLKEVLEFEIKELCAIAFLCEPFIPNTSKKILGALGNEKVTASVGMFPRI